MSVEIGEDIDRRTIAGRIGICLLNLIQPGLGLFRLERFKAGFAFVGAGLALLLLLIGYFAYGSEMQFGQFRALAATLLIAILVLYIGSIALCWRWSKGPASHPHWLSRWYGMLGLWLALQVVAWPLPDLARSYYHPYIAVSGSMAPTLVRDDRSMAHMRDYGALKRGDLVIVSSRGAEYAKRIAGLPGDRIAMRNGLVVLNGVVVEQHPVSRDAPDRDGPSSTSAMRLAEQLPGEVHPHQVLDRGPSPLDDTEEIKLGPRQYFLLGDNRDNSADSRIPEDMEGLGVVNRDWIKGRILFRFWRTGVGMDSGALQ